MENNQDFIQDFDPEQSNLQPNTGTGSGLTADEAQPAQGPCKGIGSQGLGPDRAGAQAGAQGEAMDRAALIGADETLEDLGREGLMLLQKQNGFRFGTDAVLLAHFAGLKHRESVMDLCTGSGIIPILLAGRSASPVIRGVELQSRYAEMAQRSVCYNHLEDRVRILRGDVRDLAFIQRQGSFDVVTCNPPYKEAGRGIPNPSDELMVARHEITVNLEDVIRSAGMLLREGGRLCMVHRPERLFDIYRLMAKYRLELKRIRMIAPKGGKAPNLILVEGIRGQKPYLKWEPELRIYNADGTYTDEIKEIYTDARH